MSSKNCTDLAYTRSKLCKPHKGLRNEKKMYIKSLLGGMKLLKLINYQICNTIENTKNVFSVL